MGDAQREQRHRFADLFGWQYRGIGLSTPPDFANDPAYLWPATVELWKAGWEMIVKNDNVEQCVWDGPLGPIGDALDYGMEWWNSYGVATLVALEAKRAAEAKEREDAH